MDSLNYLRNEIKRYFPESSELKLSSSFASHRRFNFYFDTGTQDRFLIYLNWEGDSDIYTLKCLEFENTAILQQLIQSYTQLGSKVFNLGKPRSAFTFVYLADDRLSILSFKSPTDVHFESKEITGNQLLQCVDPF